MKKPNGYWTKEKLQEEANKYKTRGEFWKNNASCANIALKNKLMDELFKNHNNCGYSNKKPIGYWTKEKLQEEANKCKTRIEFKKYYYAAYEYACKYKILDELFKNHINFGYLDDKWIENRYVVYAYELPQYNKVYIGLTNNIKRRDTEHIFDDRDPLFKFTKEYNISCPNYKILKDNLDSNNARSQEIYWVNYYKNNQWELLNRMKPGNLGGAIKKWSKKRLQEEANKYQNRNDFMINNMSAYIIASSKKILNELFKNHPNNGYNENKKKMNYWTIDILQEEANKYATRKDFRKCDPNHFNVAKNKKFMDELFKNHLNNGYSRNIKKNNNRIC
jgi:predicted GIY-YIG superfamily endonuclease